MSLLAAPRRTRSRSLLTGVAVVAALGLAGCGGASTDGPSEVARPATVVAPPATASSSGEVRAGSGDATGQPSATASGRPTTGAKAVGADLLVAKISQARLAAGSYHLELTVPVAGQTLTTPYDVSFVNDGAVLRGTLETAGGDVMVVGQSGSWSAQTGGTGPWIAVGAKASNPAVRSIADVVEETMAISDPSLTDSLIAAARTFTPQGSVGVGKEVATRFTGTVPIADAVKIVPSEVRGLIAAQSTQPVPVELAVDRDGRLLRLVVALPDTTAAGAKNTAGAKSAAGQVRYTLTFSRFGESKVELPALVQP